VIFLLVLSWAKKDKFKQFAHRVGLASLLEYREETFYNMTTEIICLFKQL
jgi:hypothetical protein